MNTNVAIAIFDVESEAFQAFNELGRKAVGKDYEAYESCLIQNKGGSFEVLDSFGPDPSDGTSKGIVIGSLVGILGGPIGVLLGASIGGLYGNAADTGRAVGTASAVYVIADKLYEGETAIVTLVDEDEPAFDAAFEDYKTTIIRYDAADIADDIDRLVEVEEEMSRQVHEELKAERKAERAERRAEKKAAIKAKIEAHRAEKE